MLAESAAWQEPIVASEKAPSHDTSQAPSAGLSSGEPMDCFPVCAPWHLYRVSPALAHVSTGVESTVLFLGCSNLQEWRCRRCFSWGGLDGRALTASGGGAAPQRACSGAQDLPRWVSRACPAHALCSVLLPSTTSPFSSHQSQAACQTS